MERNQFSPIFNMIDYLEQSLLSKYVRILMNSKFPEAVERNGKWNFRCNVCKDSQKSKRKKRGWIYKHRSGELKFGCFNCGKNHNLKTWLKIYFNDFYKMFLNEYLQMTINDDTKIEEKIITVKRVIEPKKNIEKDTFISIDDSNNENKLIIKAKKYVIDRNIPESVWKKWFVCIDGKMKNRLIIPFYNKEGDIYYWQGRALFSKMQPKYLNCEYDKEEIIYNLDFIDKSKPIGIVEGIIDSLFLNNSISVLSTNWSEYIQEILDTLDSYYVIDYDSSKHTKKRVDQLLKEGKKVFNWVNFIKDLGLPKKSKWDLNDVCRFINKKDSFKYEEIKSYITNSYYDLVYFKGGDF